ncbi:hypothetical protein LY78DRAFT_334614 [Colletotrichum sublineola]|nr:hypothetical protein LY78DRAFT_334614 [Colletotrichum sublineola]
MLVFHLSPHLPRKSTFAATPTPSLDSPTCRKLKLCFRQASPLSPSSVPRVAKTCREILQTRIAIPAIPPRLHAHRHSTSPPALPGRLAHLRPPLRRVAAVFLRHLPDNAHRGYLGSVQTRARGFLMAMIVQLKVYVSVGWFLLLINTTPRRDII